MTTPRRKGLLVFAWTVFAARVLALDPLDICRATNSGDFKSFYFAAVALAHGDDPYAALATYAHEAGIGAHPYLYPPLLAWLLTPLTIVEMWTARLVWEAITAAAAIGVVYLLSTSVEAEAAPATPRFDLRVAIVSLAALFWPIRETALIGQVNGVVLLLIVSWWLKRDTWRWAGALLGLAIAIKMSPALLMLYIASKRRWREGAVVVGSAGLLVLGSCLAMGSRMMAFPETVLGGFLPGGRYHSLTVPIEAYGNESLAHLALAFTGGPGDSAMQLSAAGAKLQAGMVLTMLFAWGVLQRRVTPERSLGALLVVMLLAPTYAWEHHVLFVFFSLVVLAKDALSRGLSKLAVAEWVTIAWICEHPSVLRPAHWTVPKWAQSIFNMPKIVPLLALFVLLLWRAAPRRAEAKGVTGTDR